MIAMLKTTTILQKAGESYLTALIASQQSKGLRDTGYSADHTRTQILETDSGTTLKLIGPGYWRYQEGGRGPNRSRKPGKDMVRALKAWAVRHGMDEAAGYPIALKIAREGIRVPNAYNPGGVVSDALNVTKLTANLKSELTPLVRQEVKALLFA